MKARKHVFMEKPIAVDPDGIRGWCARPDASQAGAPLHLILGQEGRSEHQQRSLPRHGVGVAVDEVVDTLVREGE